MIGTRNLTLTPEEHRRTAPGMAHFAGSGPAGKHCKDCAFFERDATCQKFKELMGRKGPSISGWQLSCRYFEARAKDDDRYGFRY